VPSAVGYSVYRRLQEWVRLTPQPVAATRFTDRSPELVNGRTQTYRVVSVFRGEDGRRAEAGPGSGRIVVRAAPIAAPPGWQGCSINEGDLTGMARFAAPAGAITLLASGADIWGEADGCYFLNQPLVGNFQMTVRALTRPTYTSPWAKAGLMIREALDPGARHVCLAATPGDGLSLLWRPLSNSSADARQVIDDHKLRLPIVLRLARQGDAITAAYSTDGGRSFQPAGERIPFYPPLAKTLYVGLALSSHNVSQMGEARFSDLQIRK
jgi:regulation of enolase protein 1 (concanavalin A-like superfamily)